METKNDQVKKVTKEMIAEYMERREELVHQRTSALEHNMSHIGEINSAIDRLDAQIASLEEFLKRMGL